MRLRGLKRDFSPVTPRLQPNDSTLVFPAIPARGDGAHGRIHVDAVQAEDRLDGELVALLFRRARDEPLVRGVLLEIGGAFDGDLRRGLGGGPRASSAKRRARLPLRPRSAGGRASDCHASSRRRDARGELLRALQRPLAIHQQQRLRRRGRALAIGGAGEAGGRIEAAQQLRSGCCAFSSCRWSGACRCRPSPGRRRCASSSPLATSIASRTCSASSRRGLKRQRIFVRRIDLRREFGHRDVRRLPVRGREQDFAMQLLQAPPFRDETPRQPVEQLGMRRLLAELAEIVRGADDAAAEVVGPDAIDDDARGQLVVGPRDPVRERGAAAGRAWRAARSSARRARAA